MTTEQKLYKIMRERNCYFEDALEIMGLPISWSPEDEKTEEEKQEDLKAEYQQEVNQAFELELQECIRKNIFPTILIETDKYISIGLKGSTYDNKDYIKSLGFKYNADKKIWGMNFKNRKSALDFFAKF